MLKILLLLTLLNSTFSLTQAQEEGELLPEVKEEETEKNVTDLPSSYKDLLDYIIPAPNQKHSGSCLYMATTGAMEILWSKHNQLANPGIDGPTDLSEVSALRTASVVPSKSWFEEPFLKWNRGGYLSKDLPYKPENFWNQFIPQGTPRTGVPPFKVETKTLFAVKGLMISARKRFGVLTEAHITKVKEALVKHESPVVVIYRDLGQERGHGSWDTWHTVVIVGYDGEGVEPGVGPCPWVKRSQRFMNFLERRTLRKAMSRGGGCREKGVFYVRDSESMKTGSSRAPQYDVRSYDWLEYLGNHGYVAYIKE